MSPVPASRRARAKARALKEAAERADRLEEIIVEYVNPLDLEPEDRSLYEELRKKHSPNFSLNTFVRV